MSEAPKEDPRVLLSRLENAEQRSREFDSLAVSMHGPWQSDIDQMEVGAAAPTTPPERKSWLTFRKRATSNGPLVTHVTLNGTDRERLREALEKLANEEKARAREIAAQLGTKAKV